ncbi:MAG: hypothetical protein KC912_03260 [Proteobacteria bacterium]|nr:hypothetical protein [Pseudomonadota bacterium]
MANLFRDWTLNVFRSAELWVPLFVFALTGVGLALATAPPDWGVGLRVGGGLLLGLFSYLFPYANRLLSEDWVA